MKQFLKTFAVVILFGLLIRVFTDGNFFIFLPLSLILLTFSFYLLHGYSKAKIFILIFAPMISSLISWPFLNTRVFNAVLVVSAFEMIFLGMIWFQLLDVLGLVRSKSD